MRRRTFLSMLSSSAAALAMGARGQQQIPSHAAARTALPRLEDPGHPPFQAAGDERFIRNDVHAGDRVSGASFASRSAAMGCSGAAGTAHPLATLAAIEILKKGGSAADAAVAANVCLGFLEPVSSGLGGDCYVMLWDPKQRKVLSMASSGNSPRALSLATARSRSKNGVLPALGAVTVSTPGALEGWWSLHQRYGRLPWSECLQPAIHLAETGVPLPQIIGFYLKRNMLAFTRPGSGVEETANAMHTYSVNGKLPGEGDVFRNPDLANTYRKIAAGGRDVFYNGEIAATIDAYFKRIGDGSARTICATCTPSGSIRW